MYNITWIIIIKICSIKQTMTKKVIIIDDNLTSLNMSKTALATDGWEVHGAQSAKYALEILYDIAPDLIITDAIMPLMGGFQFLKLLRSNPKTAKIPVIIYSILDEKNSKFYIKKERAEYYLKKDKNFDDLVNLATYVYKANRLDDDYKLELLKTNLDLNVLKEEIYLHNEQKTPKQPLNKEKLMADFKEKYDFTKSDDKIFSDIFSILYPILEYNLCVFCVDNFENRDKIAYFDIKDIILSPILQNDILAKLKTKNSFLLKKYAPNLKMIVQEEEFLSKVEFSFEYNEINIAHVIFYSKEKTKWIEDSDMDIIKNALEGFFKARYINKSSQNIKTSDLSSKYFMEKLDFKIDTQNKKQTYCAIIEIANYNELRDAFSGDELDYINSRISEKLIGFISDDEQISKNSPDEYNIVFYAKDRAHAQQKLGWIVDLLNEIDIDESEIEVIIGACNCRVEGQFNFYEAQKMAFEALDSANGQNRIVIYGTE